jgi:DNA helicase-2/ATP-dependent DNA helicase PcrA
MEPSILEGLTPEQQEAVTHVEGPLLVLAGPGSGKTRVITHRIAYLLSLGVPDYQILGITFTNKAAQEMAVRLERQVPGHRVWLGTFHKFCSRLLRQYGERLGLSPQFVIFDTEDRIRLIRKVMEQLQIDRSAVDLRAVETIISRAKNQCVPPEDWRRQEGSELVARIYERYQQLLWDLQALDFDDLLLYAAKLLAEDGELRELLDRHFRFILVDEYQDTNEVQYRIVRMLSKVEPNLCVTGDPDQSIYGWRGATVRNILSFEQDYPGCKVVRLERNFRSTEAILTAADRLIQYNVQRKAKQMVPIRRGGLPVRVRVYETETAEAGSIAAEIRAAVDQGQRAYRDFAIFCRVSALTRVLEEALRRARVPYRILSGVAFYERAEVKDLLAYLRLVVNPRDDLSFLRGIRVPPRRVGATTLESLERLGGQRQMALLDLARMADQFSFWRPAQAAALKRFAELVDRWRGQAAQTRVGDLIRQVLEESGYRLWLRNVDRSEERVANIEELVTAAEAFDRSTPGGTLEQFLQESALATDVDRWDPAEDAVAVMTLHSAKGLEFPVVYIVAVEEGILPHARSLERLEELEEERRLLFVGMTRAREELYLSYARARAFRGMESPSIPSRFFGEIGIPAEGVGLVPGLEEGTWGEAEAWGERPAGQPVAQPVRPLGRGAVLRKASEWVAPGVAPSSTGSLKLGMRVLHPHYGIGYVVGLEGMGESQRVRISFTTGDTKTFIAGKAPLQPLP